MNYVRRAVWGTMYADDAYIVSSSVVGYNNNCAVSRFSPNELRRIPFP